MKVSPGVDASVGTPAWIAREFYTGPDFPLGEYATPAFMKVMNGRESPGRIIKNAVRAAVHPLRLAADTAVYGTTLNVGKPARVAEWYTFLVRSEGRWKIQAVRRSEFSPEFHLLADSVDKHYRVVDAPKGVGTSLRLAVGSDSALKAYLLKHRVVLDSLADVFHNDRTAPIALDVMDAAAVAVRLKSKGAVDPHGRVHALLERARVSSVFRGDKFKGCTFVRVSGEGRAQVGFIRADDGCKVPVPDPNTFIYVEHVSGPWYAYRTS